MTAHSDLEKCCGILSKAGAFEFYQKPFDVEEAVSLVKRAILHHRNARPSTDFYGREAEPEVDKEIIGEAPAMQRFSCALVRLANQTSCAKLT